MPLKVQYTTSANENAMRLNPKPKARLVVCCIYSITGKAGINVAIVSTKQVLDLARSRNQKAKTGKLDAHNIAYFATVMKPRVFSPPTPYFFLHLQTSRRRMIEIIAYSACRFLRGNANKTSFAMRSEREMAYFTANHPPNAIHFIPPIDNYSNANANYCLTVRASAAWPVDRKATDFFNSTRKT
jgi:hypothetical protein